MAAEDDTTRSGRGGADSLYGSTLGAGALCGEYEIEGKLAAGGCGTVYRARHRLLGRRAAVKVLHRDLARSQAMLHRFVAEAKAVNLIDHPSIVDIYEFGRLPDGRPFHVMELIEGESLGALVSRAGRLGVDEAIELLAPVCAALQAAHEVGVIHRDLKPSNVIVSEAGGRRSVKLVDFGIAKFTQPEPGAPALTRTDELLGTPQSMAPEQFRGQAVDARTDVYALGLLLYYMITGRPAFDSGDALELRRQHLEGPPPVPSALAPVAPAVDELVARSLSKEPSARPASARDFIEALRAATATRFPAAGAVGARPAFGLYVEVRLDDAAEELDDALLEEAAGVAEAAERHMRERGYLIPLTTGTATLGVLLLPEDETQRRAAVRGAVAEAETLHARIVAGVRSAGLEVHLHVDRALVRQLAEGAAVFGGALTRLEDWVARDAGPGLHRSAAVLAMLRADE